jgi:type I restriction-modification system DNA methylase subunit
MLDGQRIGKEEGEGLMAQKANKAQTVLVSVAESEVEAYDFIRRRLRELEWVVKNPSLNTGGQVWTQNQCLSHPEIKRALGLTRPENIIKIKESAVWVVEAKPTRKQLAQALDEAVNFYSKPINQKCKGKLQALIASGVAGNEASGYLVKTVIRLDGRWRTVTKNRQEATGLLSPADVNTLLTQGDSDIHDFAPPQRLFLQAAERINEILHIGSINKNDRAKTMAALLLSVIKEPPNLDVELPVLIGEINARSETRLKENDKPDFAPFVKILPPTNITNHVKFKNALVRTIQELLELNIASAMNSSTDILGQFYEVFLKYGNGAKEIGIVLTPRHITRFAVQAVGVSSGDVVLDCACGTGGFLVAAFDHVRETSSPKQLERFKEYNLFGIEQESYVAVLAIVNMIFRGDGKHNITEGDCFKTFLTRRTVDGHPSAEFTKQTPAPGQEAVTRVLMNPPFTLASQEKEYKFVSHALSQMADGGVLFSLLPMDSMFGSHDERVWRRDDLLKHHTLLSVISLPHELFVPAALKQVVAIIVKKGIPHPPEQTVFWARISRDGFIKVKSKRLLASELEPPRSELDHTQSVLPSLRNFISHPGTVDVNVPLLCKTAPIDFDDPLLELLPEAYIDSNIPTKKDIDNAVDNLLRETASFLIRFKKETIAEELHADD